MDYQYSRATLNKSFIARFCASLVISGLFVYTVSLHGQFDWTHMPIELASMACMLVAVVAYNVISWRRSRFPLAVCVTEQGDLKVPGRLFPHRLKTIRAADIIGTRITELRDAKVLRIDLYGSGPLIFASTQFEDANVIERIQSNLGKPTEHAIDLPLPFAAIGLCAGFVVVFLFTNPSGSLTLNSDLISYGAFHRDLFAIGEYYRLLSHAFLHKTYAHLIINVSLLFVMGSALEHVWARLRFLSIFLVGAIISSFGVYASDHALLVGSSGGIYALVGAYVCLRLFKPREFDERYRNVSTWMILFVLAMEASFSIFLDRIAVSVHLAGLAAGVLSYFLFDVIGNKKGRILDYTVAALSSALLIQGVYAGITWNSRQAGRELANFWLTEPNGDRYIRTAAWMVATMKERDDSMLATAIDRLQRLDLSAPDKDTLATLYARSGDFERAVSIENEVFTAAPDTIFATQLARFELRHNVFAVDHRVEGETLRVDEPATIDFICGDRFERMPVERSAQLAGLCKTGPQLLAIRPGLADKSTRLRLDDRVLALPLD